MWAFPRRGEEDFEFHAPLMPANKGRNPWKLAIQGIDSATVLAHEPGEDFVNVRILAI